jgi:hypothetical protein
MATTRELVSYILEHDENLRYWFEVEHHFTVEKVRTGPLDDYQNLLGVIITDGILNNVITQEQADGTIEL